MGKRALGGWMGPASGRRALWFLQPERVLESAGEFFIWILCNPLKRRESTKGIQGKPSLSPWDSLVLFAFPWSKFAHQVVLIG
jgi:hypothetical protein